MSILCTCQLVCSLGWRSCCCMISGYFMYVGSNIENFCISNSGRVFPEPVWRMGRRQEHRAGQPATGRKGRKFEGAPPQTVRRLNGHGRSTRCKNRRTTRLAMWVNEIWKSMDVKAELHETKILGYTSVTSKTSSRPPWTRALHPLTTKCGVNPSRLKKTRCFLVQNR